MAHKEEFELDGVKLIIKGWEQGKIDAITGDLDVLRELRGIPQVWVSNDGHIQIRRSDHPDPDGPVCEGCGVIRTITWIRPFDTWLCTTCMRSAKLEWKKNPKVTNELEEVNEQ